MANPLSFSFWADQPSGPGSYEALQARRKIAESLLGKRSPFPQTLGQGLTYAGERFADVMAMRDLDRREAAREAMLGGEATRAYRPQQDAGVSPDTPTDIRPDPSFVPPDRAVTAGPRPPQMAALTPSTEPAEPAPSPSDAVDKITATIVPPPRPIGSGGIPLPPPRPVYDRNKQLAEMQADPALEQRIRTIARGESANPREQQIIAETIFNRAAARNQPLEQVTRQYTGPGSSGYYPASTFGRGQISEDALTPVLRGSDLGGETLGFSPTGNASGGVAARGVASGRYGNSRRLDSGETYVTQENPTQLTRLAGTRLDAGNRSALTTEDIGKALLSPQPDFAPTTESGGGSGPTEAPTRVAALTPAVTGIPSAPPAGRVNDAFSALPSAAPAPPPTQTAQAGPAPYTGLVPRQPTEAVELYPRDPDRPRPTPQSQRELQALQRMATFPNDPGVQQIWAPIAQREAANRAFADKIADQEYQARLARVTAAKAANQTAARTAADDELKRRKAEQGLVTQAPAGQATPGMVQTRFGPYDTRLGTDVSPQIDRRPDAEPVPAGGIPEVWAEGQTKKIAADIAAGERAAPQFKQAINLLQQARAHPGREHGVGALGPFAGLVYGSNALGFAEIIKQINNQNFLSAYDTLRGGGQIANIEGEKATQAKARLNRAQSPDDFEAALKDYEEAMRGDYERVQRRLHQPVTAWQLSPNDRRAPDIGEIDTTFDDGIPRRYLGGNPRDLKNNWQMLR